VLIAIAILLLLFVLPPAVGVAVVIAAVLFEGIELLFWRRFLSRYRISAGPEAMVGETGVVVRSCEPSGTVRVRGEVWNARCNPGAAAGDRVRITAVEGLTLEVEAVPS
jgi:membrane-bound serine protease (ClpP class)